MEKALKESEERYRTIFETTGTATIIIEEDTTISLCNSKTRELFSLSSNKEMEGKSWTEFTHKDDLPKMIEYHHLRRVDKNSAPGNYEFRIIDKEGNIRYVLASISMIPGTKKSIASLQDITDRRKSEEQLRYLSMHDSLTGLYNRAYFEQELKRLEGGRCHPVGVIMCDVDGLKQVNDILGHEKGDMLLVAAARIILSSFRKSDVVARIGGDEFACLLPTTPAIEVENICHRIKSNMDSYNKQTPFHHLSISIGYAISSSPTDLKNILKEADDKMYLNKKLKSQNYPDIHSTMH